MQISKNPGRANEMGLEITVSSIHCLRPFEEEETRARTMICLDESHSYTIGVRDEERSVHRERVDPFFIDRKHMDNQVCGSFRTIYWAVLPT
jgi:hypothetical protein